MYEIFVLLKFLTLYYCSDTLECVTKTHKEAVCGAEQTDLNSMDDREIILESLARLKQESCMIQKDALCHMGHRIKLFKENLEKKALGDLNSILVCMDQINGIKALYERAAFIVKNSIIDLNCYMNYFRRNKYVIIRFLKNKEKCKDFLESRKFKNVTEEELRGQIYDLKAIMLAAMSFSQEYHSEYKNEYEFIKKKFKTNYKWFNDLKPLFNKTHYETVDSITLVPVSYVDKNKQESYLKKLFLLKNGLNFVEPSKCNNVYETVIKKIQELEDPDKDKFLRPFLELFKVRYRILSKVITLKRILERIFTNKLKISEQKDENPMTDTEKNDKELFDNEKNGENPTTSTKKHDEELFNNEKNGENSTTSTKKHDEESLKGTKKNFYNNERKTENTTFAEHH